MLKEIEAKVTGRVQGIMFRDFTMRKARGLGISGTVENLKDGSVRIVAVGEEGALRTFLNKIHKGPTFSRVENVEVKWSNPVHSFSGFDIVYSHDD